MSKILLLILVTSLPNNFQSINDSAHLLTEKQKDSLSNTLQSIKRQTNLNLTILTVTNTETHSTHQLIEDIIDERGTDNLNILIIYDANQQFVDIKLGSKVKKYLDEKQIDLIAKRFNRTTVHQNQLFLSIEKTAINISGYYLRNKEEASNDIKAKVVIAILLLIFAIIMWRLSRAGKSYHEPKIRKWKEDEEKRKTFGQ